MTDRTIAQPPNGDLDAEALEWFARYSDVNHTGFRGGSTPERIES